MSRTPARAARALGALCVALAGVVAAAATPPVSELKVPHVSFRERRLANGLDVISVESHSSPTVARPGLVSRRRPRRSGRPLRLRPPLRAHDVQGHEVPARRAVRPPDRRRGRLEQRLDRQRRHRVPRGRSLEPPRDAALGRGRANAEPARSTRPTSSPSAPSSRRSIGSASWPSPYGRFFSAVYSRALSAASLQAPDNRQHRRSRRGDAGRRAPPSTAATTGPTTPRSSSPATSIRASSTPGSTSISRRSRKPATPLPARDAIEPPWTSDRTITVTAPRVPLPATAVVWLAPPVTSADAPALRSRRRDPFGRRVVAPEPGARLSPADRRRRPASMPTCAPARACSSRTRSPPAASRSTRCATPCSPKCSASPTCRRRRPRSTRSRTSSSPTPSSRGRRRAASARRSPRRPCSKATRERDQHRPRGPAARHARRRAARDAPLRRRRAQGDPRLRPGSGAEMKSLASALPSPRSQLACAGAASAQPFATPPPPAPPRPLTIAAPSRADAGQRPARHHGAPRRRADRERAAGRAVGQRGRSAAACRGWPR